MVTSIREQIFEQSETPSAPVSSALIPNINNMLGVRLPPLRKLAKEIAKDDWRSYLNLPENQFFEEFMLQGMVIGCKYRCRGVTALYRQIHTTNRQLVGL